MTGHKEGEGPFRERHSRLWDEQWLEGGPTRPSIAEVEATCLYCRQIGHVAGHGPFLGV